MSFVEFLFSYFSFASSNHEEPLRSWSYGSMIYNYLCNQYISPLTFWARIPFMARCTSYNIIWSSVSVTCGGSLVFSGYSLSPTYKNDRHDITKILLKMALCTITLAPYPMKIALFVNPRQLTPPKINNTRTM